MGSTATSAPASPEFLAAFRRAAGAAGVVTFARFMELALYDRQAGYYSRPATRIGYQPGTDFFTASTSGRVFGELVAAGCVALLGPGQDPAAYTFVEIGAETDGGVLDGVAHPFRASETIGLGRPIELGGRCVVFSNEVFDAQPCNRFIFRAGGWRELGVALEGMGLKVVELPDAVTAPELPPRAPEGYIIDAPFGAKRLAAQIARQPWSGLFVAFDYGKSWRELTEATPAGTARAYFRHTQSNDLLARPGQQDLTCHICWDWLAQAMEQQGFSPAQVESQESFFIRHAGGVISRTSAADAGRFSRRKQALMQLLHPAHLGQKFQVLHAPRFGREM